MPRAVSNPHPMPPLIPFPLRITPQQQDRLRNCRHTDGISMQDHARRAMDMYLDHMDTVYARRSAPPGGSVGVGPAHPVAPPEHKPGAGSLSADVPTNSRPQAVFK